MSDPAPYETAPETTISVRPDVGMITLRGNLGSQRLAESVRDIAGCDVPAVRRIETGEGGAVAWMSPDELLLIVGREQAPQFVAQIADALKGEHHLVADVSDARVVLHIAGPGAGEVLAKGAPVDLAPGVFRPRDLRRTRLGQVPVAFWMVEQEVFNLICFRSVATFVEDWLVTAARPKTLPNFFRRGV